MSGGFKWKEKASGGVGAGVGNESRGLERGYKDGVERDRERERERIREKERERSPVRDDVRNKFGDDYQSRYSRPQKTEEDDISAKFGSAATKEGEQGGEKEKKKEKKHKVKAPKPTNEPMIVVNVNDRLGTKAQIPCLASDPISELIPQDGRMIC